MKKNKVTPFAATWTALQMIKLSDVRQREKDTYCIISLIYGI